MNKVQLCICFFSILLTSGKAEIRGQDNNLTSFGDPLTNNVIRKSQTIPGNILQLYDYQYNYSSWPKELPIENENFHPDSTTAWTFVTPEDSVLINRKSLSYNLSGNIEEFQQDTLFGFILHSYGMHSYNNRIGRYNYSDSGDIISFKLKPENGGIIEEKKWNYNDDGLLTDFTWKGGRYFQISKTYYPNGSPKKQERIIKMCQHYSGLSGCLSWDELERKIIYFNREGIPESGLIIKQDSIPVKYDYEFNEDENFELIREITNHNNDSTVITTSLKNTKENSRVLEYTYESFTFSSRRFYNYEKSVAEYNKEGDRISGKYYRWDFDKKITELHTTDSLIYDSSGRLRYIHSMSWDDEFKGSDHLREFQYDSKGNLTSYGIYNRGFLNEWSLYERRYYYHPIEVRSTNIVKDFDEKIIIYPNPASEYIFIDRAISGYKYFHYEIHDLRGLKLLSGSLNGNSGQGIDISGLKQGIYLLYFYEEGNRKEIFFSKIIKQ
ncbi:MAG: T9SS type A sorting domain-containing protein [Bacteroidota bacterium]